MDYVLFGKKFNDAMRTHEACNARDHVTPIPFTIVNFRTKLDVRDLFVLFISYCYIFGTEFRFCLL